MTPAPSSFFRRWLPFFLTGLGLLVLAIGLRSHFLLPEGARWERMTLHVHAAFLDVGIQHRRRLGAPVEVGTVQEGGGIAPVRIWHATALTKFKRDESGVLRELGIVPISRDPASDGWAVWRHRHGYGFHPGDGYFWNTLSDDRVPMAWKRGEMYDAFLKSVWSYWTIIGLETQRLKGPQKTVEPAPALERNVPVAVGPDGLAKPLALDLQINPWRVPVRVHFEVRPSTAGVAGTRAPIRWDYDMNEWRERHGYKKGLFTGYGWVDGFPEPFEMSTETGRALDELLERAMALWSEAVFEQLAADYERQIARLAARIPAP